MNHPAYQVKLGPNQGRGVASGYWFNGGGESSATLQVNADGTVLVATGSPDVGGSRASMAIMAAETLGVDYNTVRAIVADTGVGRLHPRHRRIARHLRHRHRRGERREDRGEGTVQAGRADLGRG